MLVQHIKHKNLSIAEYNARSKKAVNGVDTLAASIKAMGLLCPLIGISEGGKSSAVHVIAGQRRLAAIDKIRRTDLSAFNEIPVYIVEGVTVAQAIEMSLHENIERELLTPVDEAEAFHRMVKEGAGISDIAANFGRSERFVNQRLEIALLPSWVKKGLVEDTVSIGVAQILTSASGSQLKDMGKRFKVDPNTFLFTNAPTMIRSITEGSRIRQEVALFDVQGSGLSVILNLFDDDMNGLIPEVDQFWEMQNAAIQEKKEEFEAEGHEVEVYGRDEHHRQFDYQQSKAKKHLVIIQASYDGSVEITTGLKRKAAKAETAASTEGEEPATKDNLTKLLTVEMNELRSMSVACAVALGAGRGYVTQAANLQMMFGSHFSSNGGSGQPHNWNEDLAAEHDQFSTLEETAQSVCDILEIKVPDGSWALNVIAHPRLSNCDYHQVIHSILTMDDAPALVLQGVLVAAHTVNVCDHWDAQDSYNIVEMIGGFLESEEEDGFSGNQDWELNERVINGIRNKDTLATLIALCQTDGAVPELAFDKKTKTGDLKKLLVAYMNSNNGRKAPWLDWLDFPAKELG